MKLKTLASLSLINLIVSLVSVGGHAQTFSIIHSFTAIGVDGKQPWAGVTLREGALYGTTVDGGNGCGTVYKITHTQSTWIYAPIYIFKGGQFELDGCDPYARVVYGPDGHLYGTTFAGGSGNGGNVFTLTPQLLVCRTVACFWTQTIIHDFNTGGTNDGGPGYGDLVWDQQGHLYGTAEDGGTGGRGSVFQMTKSGNNWTYTSIFNFQGNDGSPANGVIVGNNGKLYGTNLGGNVFELTYVPGIGWTENIIFHFNNEWPYAGLVMDASGNLYGATSSGGTGGAGVAFELSPSGDTWVYKPLHYFSGQSYCGPWQSLTLDTDGNLYGTTLCAGAHNLGNVFKLTHVGDSWVYTSLHDFKGFRNDGAEPISQVTIDTDGTLYGTTTQGGQGGWGTVWMIKP